ncbi:protein of unknown function [Burkholderia multivorans]
MGLTSGHSSNNLQRFAWYLVRQIPRYPSYTGNAL